MQVRGPVREIGSGPLIVSVRKSSVFLTEPWRTLAEALPCDVQLREAPSTSNETSVDTHQKANGSKPASREACPTWSSSSGVAAAEDCGEGSLDAVISAAARMIAPHVTCAIALGERMGGLRREVRGPPDRLHTVSGVFGAQSLENGDLPRRPPSLIVIRGNSGSGKSTTALALRKAAGRGVALVQQDVIRRDLLRERDRPGALNIELIKLNVQFALGHDYDVILEGILFANRYGSMIRTLLAEHEGPTFVYYYDLPFEETLRRHASKPNSHEYGEEEMAGWFVERDLLGVPGEEIIGPDQSQAETVARILAETLPPRRRPGNEPQPEDHSHTAPAGTAEPERYGAISL